MEFSDVVARHTCCVLGQGKPKCYSIKPPCWSCRNCAACAVRRVVDWLDGASCEDELCDRIRKLREALDAQP